MELTNWRGMVAHPMDQYCDFQMTDAEILELRKPWDRAVAAGADPRDLEAIVSAGYANGAFEEAFAAAGADT